MFKENGVSREYTTEAEWLEDIFYKSNSQATLINSKTALKTFDLFCQKKLGIENPDEEKLAVEFRKKNNLKAGCGLRKYPAFSAFVNEIFDKIHREARKEVVEQYREWFEQPKPDVQSICTSIQKWIRFCIHDHEDVRISTNKTWKAKKPSSVRQYFSILKDYLRKCEGIRLTLEDVKDYIKFPKHLKQLREPTSLEIIKKIMAHADPARRALYYVLLTSGMRLGEGLSLKKTSFNIDVRPIQVHLRAQDTKTGEARDTYISEECWEKIAPFYEATKDGEHIFHNYGDKYKAVVIEDKYFGRLRDKIAKKYGDKAPCDEYPEGTGILKHYEDSIRHVVQIHAFRAWFMTKASMKHGSDYAHALAGHHGYLDQYIRIPEKQKSKMYLELEKDLIIESSRVHSEQFHQVEIAEMQEKILKLEAMSERKAELSRRSKLSKELTKKQFDHFFRKEFERKL